MSHHCRAASRLLAATFCCACVLAAVGGCQSADREKPSPARSPSAHSEPASASPHRSATHAPSDAMGHPWRYEGVEPGFPTGGWTFFSGTDGVFGLPVEAFLKLWAQKDGTAFCIETPQELGHLDGLVIGSESDALALAELFTKTDTFYLFRWRDVLSIDCPEDPEDVKAGHIWIAPEFVESMGYAPATVTRDGDAFVVHRYLLER